MTESTSIQRHLISRVSINLLANLLQGVLGIILIPLATYVLSPVDYGVYGMASVIVALVVAMCETGSTYVLYGHYLGLDTAGRATLQSTLLVLALALGLFAGGLLFLAWPAVSQYVPLLSELTPTEIGLLCFTIPLRTSWAIMNPILIVNQRSNLLAASVLLQSIVNMVVMLVCLYLFDSGRAALFWGQAGGLLACLALPLFLLGASVWVPLSWQWLLQVRKVALGAWCTGLVDNTRSAIESALIARTASGDVLGNYNHARVYQGLMTQGTNAFSNVLWPVALKEAQVAGSQFTRIRPIWDLVYAGLACAGVGAVFLGNELVSLLTHGKFLEAGAWLPWLMVYVMLQSAGKPATAMIFASQEGNQYSLIRTSTVLTAVLALLLLVPVFGVAAVLAVAIGEMLMTRAWLAAAVRRISPVPFQDHWVVVGSVLTVACCLLEPALDLALIERCLVTAGFWCLIAGALFLTLRMRLGVDWYRSLYRREARHFEDSHV
ncbi:lipopolysaccharide biosynthesis protein [Laribacter hongkongensis]|uniref:lipopolysaccharide biosynthesis protein n=1 Tax=Laribacter hongkongensis TaxID=168471 RepID=UPI001EFE7971|nr:oligosaccharide flippase family protein [Laribacter hongkongensis]MCG9095355.1 oligosaccharide flippase family protein [Laribacter hongkongensis]